ncbi:hypothetical protein ACFWP2_03605 [Kitasatospora sp. NPDC058444]|uniref:hypothetical protein n=1 Tax=Kitasatospora sp. NPDC058444 TaxID=3346504 RepID=UPI0036528270
MNDFRYATSWFAPKISDHDAVESATQISSRHLMVQRKYSRPFSLAAVTGVETLTPKMVDKILDETQAEIICLVPKASHYLWAAREKAQARGSDVQTMSEVFWAITEEDPKGFLNKDVAITRRILGQHSRVRTVEMICEASMKLIREGARSDLHLAVEYQYEFGVEALVRALERHPGVKVVLNSNPNGRETSAALTHAGHAGVRLLGMSSLMSELGKL